MNVLRILIISIAIILTSTSLFGQPKSKVTNKATKSYLYGNYIPKDINDACLFLDKVISDEAKRKFISLPEEIAAKKLFFGFGKWMRIKWNMDDISRYTVYFNKEGLSFPDDIIFVTMRSYHRYLSKKDIELKSLVLEYYKKRKESQKEKENKKKQNQKVISIIKK